MAYINIPETNLPANIAAQVGKLQGLLSTQVDNLVNKVVTDLSQDEALPLDKLEKLTDIKDKVSSTITKVNSRLSEIKQKTEKLKPPLEGLKLAADIILSLPIPQAVPPGVGLPINVTTKYADQLVTLKESTKQLNETISSIDATLEEPTKQVQKLKEKTSKLDAGLILGKGESKLNSFLTSGKVALGVLVRAGLADSDGFSLFSKLRPRFIKNIDTASVDEMKKEIDNLNYKFQNSNEISQELKDEFGKLLVFLPFEEKQDRESSKIYNYKGFALEIVEDKNSPEIARRHYAEAKNNKGVVVAKSASSFSSNTEVLIDELKFLIDTQLP